MVQKRVDTPAPSALVQTLGRFRSNPLALWRGYGALASRNLPFTALQFPMFEHLRQALTRWRGEQTGQREQDVSVWERGLVTAISAGSAGAVAAAVTTPVDVVKTRIMLAAAESAQGGDGSKALEAIKSGKVLDAVGAVRGNGPSPRGSIDIAKEIVREHGWKGLFRGGGLRCVWTMLGSGLYLGVYESGRTYLANRREHDE